MKKRARSAAPLLWTAVGQFLCWTAQGWAPAPGGQASAQVALQAAIFRSLSLEDLSQIEVTSPSKEPVPAFRSPVAIAVITGDDIRRSGATTIPEVLRLAPGVEVARIDGNKWSVGIRGFGTRLSRSVLVLIDGRSVYTPLFAGTYWEVQDTLLEDVDRIEVIRGPGGNIWGPNAVNGVINIITKSSKDTHGVYSSVGSGNEEQAFLNFRYGGATSRGLNYRLYTKSFTRGPEFHRNAGNFDDWRGVQGGFRMDWESRGRDRFTLQGDVYRQESGERVSVGSYTPPRTFDVSGNASLSGANAMLRWVRTYRGGSNVQVQTYYDRTSRFEPNLGETRNTLDVDVLARTVLSSRHELQYGLEARGSWRHFEQIVSTLVFDPEHRLDYLVSGFLQETFTLAPDRLSLVLGTKIFRTNFSGFQLEPNARLLWTPADKTSLWASFTHAVRTPSDAERDFYLSSYIGDANGLPLFARFNPNRWFAPEQVNGYEVGFRQLLGKKVYLDVAGFYNRHHNLFSQNLAGPIALQTTLPYPAPLPPPAHLLLPAEFRNDLYGSTKGGEISPEWRPLDWLRLRGSYSYLDMHLKKRPGTALGADPAAVSGSSPRHQLMWTSSFDLPQRVQVDLLLRYVSAVPAQLAPEYSTADVRVGWRLSDHLEFSVAGRNLLQPHHVEFNDVGGPVGIRRSVYASVAWR